jgi:hypothetical protein
VDLSLTWRRTRATEHYEGIKHQVVRERLGNNVRNVQHILDLRLDVQFDERWSGGASVPWLLGSWGVPLPLPLPIGRSGHGPRYNQRSSGLGDIALAGRAWLLDPSENPRGNIQFGLGVELPTGDPGQKERFRDINGQLPRLRPVDVSIQPGDGGWGVLAEVGAFRDVGSSVRLFLSATYLAQPREENTTLSTASVLFRPASMPRHLRYNSVPDQYLGVAGASLRVADGVSLSAALRIEGVPPRDRWGGNDGFRRPGYTVSVVPGVAFEWDRYSLSISAPIAVRRNRQENARGEPGDATFADSSLFVTLGVRF